VKSACDGRKVCFGTRVLVHDQNGDGRAERLPFENAGENLAAVGFIALRDNAALAGTSTIQFALNVGFVELQARRTSIDYNPNAATVRFAPGGNAEEVAEAVAHRTRSVTARWKITTEHRFLTCAASGLSACCFVANNHQAGCPVGRTRKMPVFRQIAVNAIVRVGCRSCPRPTNRLHRARGVEVLPAAWEIKPLAVLDKPPGNEQPQRVRRPRRGHDLFTAKRFRSATGPRLHHHC